jgi:hypothetical protein
MYFSALGVTPNTSGTDWYLFMDQMWVGQGRFPQRFQPQESQGLSNSTGEVLIDTSGITIRNGKLTVMDEFGFSQLAAGGLTGGAAELTSLGLQNGTMRGTGAASDGRTAAFPYWTLLRSNPSNIGVEAWSEGSVGTVIEGERFLKMVAAGGGSDSVGITSDLVPVQSGAYYGVNIQSSASLSSGSISVIYEIGFYHPNGSTLQSAPSVGGRVYAASSANNFDLCIPVQCPANAKYARVKVWISMPGSVSQWAYVVLQGVSLLRVANSLPPILLVGDDGRLQFTTGAWGGGGNQAGFTNASGSTAIALRAKGLYVGEVYSQPGPPSEGIQFGNNVNLYRSSDNALKTDDLFEAAGAIIAGAYLEARGGPVYIDDAASYGIYMGWTSGWNTRLYSPSQGLIKTDTSLVAANIRAGQNVATGDGTAFKTITITFSSAMPATPRVVATVTTSTSFYMVTANSISSSSFNVTVSRRDGAVFSSAIAVDWIAVSGFAS